MNWKIRVLYETNGADHMEEFFCQNKRGAYWAFKTWKGKLACYGVALYLKAANGKWRELERWCFSEERFEPPLLKPIEPLIGD